MDSFTHIVLGGVVVALATPLVDRRRALVAGAILNTLPDLDVVVLRLLAVDPVTDVTWHRGPAHSMLLLPWFGLALWALLRKVWAPVSASPARWLLAIELGLLTHPLLDGLTTYGTQMLWPLPTPPVMWSSLFIIDPLLTLPLLIAFVATLWIGPRPASQTWLATGLALALAYAGWSLVAKTLVDRSARDALAAMNLENAQRFSVPMPFTTLLWRVVVMTDTGFLEGERSLVADRGPMHFQAYPSAVQARSEVAAFPDIRRIEWFTHGFSKYEQRDGKLILSDLRMGAEPDYSFRFVVAERSGDGWVPVRTEQLKWPWEARARLSGMWHRIWNEPAAQRDRP